jgi:LmbE family N-acetylglucosaminyl deacetylase
VIVADSKSQGEEIRVLVVLAHPDDPEFFCGGTVARWSAEGRRVSYCLLTHGERGADGSDTDLKELARRRVREQKAAAKVLGVEDVLFLDHPDGYLEPTLELRKDIVRVIRGIRPEIVITCDPSTFFPRFQSINHADHRAAGAAALDAVFPAARSSLYFPELESEEGLKPHKVKTVFVAGSNHPNIDIDVTEYLDLKLKALAHHTSQIRDMESVANRVRERMRDPQSPPDHPRYFERFLRIEMR